MFTRFSILALMLVVTPLAGRAADPAKYGAGVSLTEAMPIEQVIATPASFEGKTVRVDGTVTAVCDMMGCWMALAPSADARTTLMIKVEDGVVVLPVSAKGKRASAQGVVERVGGDHESREAAAEHAAGAKADKPAQWQLKATGALIY